MDYKIYHKKGIEVKYFPDDKVLMITPKAGVNKHDFLKVKSKLDTLLQITGTKRQGNTFSLKLDDNSNVNVDELLKSLNLKGGIEQEDAASMVDDAAKEDAAENQKEQAPEVQVPPEQPEEPNQMPEGFVFRSAYKFLFEDFEMGPTADKKRRQGKRHGKYWKNLEQYSGKNRMKIQPEDVLEIRKQFARKPPSSERNLILRSLDKAADYFFKKITRLEGEGKGKDYNERYQSIDSLQTVDYEDENKDLDIENDDATLPELPELNFDDIDYNNIEIEKQ